MRMNNTNRWFLYSLLKGGRVLLQHPDPELIDCIKRMERKELEEGIIEFLLMLRDEGKREIRR